MRTGSVELDPPSLPAPNPAVPMTTGGSFPSERFSRRHIWVLRMAESSLPLSSCSSVWVRGPVPSEHVAVCSCTVPGWLGFSLQLPPRASSISLSSPPQLPREFKRGAGAYMPPVHPFFNQAEVLSHSSQLSECSDRRGRGRGTKSSCPLRADDGDKMFLLAFGSSREIPGLPASGFRMFIEVSVTGDHPET